MVSILGGKLVNILLLLGHLSIGEFWGKNLFMSRWRSLDVDMRNSKLRSFWVIRSMVVRIYYDHHVLQQFYQFCSVSNQPSTRTWQGHWPWLSEGPALWALPTASIASNCWGLLSNTLRGLDVFWSSMKRLLPMNRTTCLLKFEWPTFPFNSFCQTNKTEFSCILAF